MLYKTALGSVIREIRLEQGKTLRQLSAIANVSLGHISDVERGTKDISSELVACIAKGLGLPMAHLVIESGYRMAMAEDLFVPEELRYEIVTKKPLTIAK